VLVSTHREPFSICTYERGKEGKRILEVAAYIIFLQALHEE
jgi:hypothetical protein